MSIVSNPVLFNYVNLESITGLTVLSVNNYMPPKRSLSEYGLARTDASVITAGFYTDKSIIVKVGISRATRELAEQSLDSLMALLQDREQDLIVKQSGNDRRYTATYSDAVFHISGGSYMEVDLIFKLSDKYGYDTGITVLVPTTTGRTLYNYTDSFTVAGTAPWQLPVIKLTFTALTGGTSKEVDITNPSNDMSMSITRTWTAGDILIVDCLNQTVTVNGSNVDFSGPFPMWEPGPGYIQIQDNLATRTKTTYVYYYKRYV